MTQWAQYQEVLMFKQSFIFTWCTYKIKGQTYTALHQQTLTKM
jgi:hypothetical protein